MSKHLENFQILPAKSKTGKLLIKNLTKNISQEKYYTGGKLPEKDLTRNSCPKIYLTKGNVMTYVKFLKLIMILFVKIWERKFLSGSCLLEIISFFTVYFDCNIGP